MSHGTTTVSRDERVAPFFSVCIPQWNRTSYLLKVLESLDAQSFRDFEVCISDDRSPDGRGAEIVEFLERSSMSFRYRMQEKNVRYDINLRTSIELARGRYCFLLGNDDSLASPDTLGALHGDIVSAGFPAVVITNFEDFATGEKTVRVGSTGVLGAGPRVAAESFRNFAFVSGIVMERARLAEHATDRWDGSEMYQMLIGSRIIAQGGAVLTVERSTVRKDVQIPGLGAVPENYARAARIPSWPPAERQSTLTVLGRLVAGEIEPFCAPREREAVIERIFNQILSFTYPFWLVEYRRVQSWAYAMSVCLGMRPRLILAGVKLEPLTRLRITSRYVASSAAALSVPVGVFGILRPLLYGIAKRRSAPSPRG